MLKTNKMSNNIEGRIEINVERIEYLLEHLYLGQLVSFQAREKKDIERLTENIWIKLSIWDLSALCLGVMGFGI